VGARHVQRRRHAVDLDVVLAGHRRQPTYGSLVYGLVEFDDAPAAGNAVAGATTLGATDGANLFANVGAQPVAQDAPTATHKASWGELKARYR
jgi:hypothetical protein